MEESRCESTCILPIDVYKRQATAFADPDNEIRVQAAFSKLSQGKTVIMIAHRLSTVAGADQIYVSENGQITESGKSSELLEKDGIFNRMWQDYQLAVQWKRCV